MSSQGFAHRCAAIACGLALVASGPLGTASAAFAGESSEHAAVQQQANEMAQKVEEASVAYQEATAKVESVRKDIDENEKRTTEIEGQLGDQRARTAESVKAMYLMQQSSPSLIGLILSSESFNEFITTVSYLDSVQDKNAREVQALADLTNELATTKEKLASEYKAAEELEEQARTSLEETRAAKLELQQRADEIAAAEEQARLEAIAAAQKAIDQSQQKTDEEKASEQEAAQEGTQPEQDQDEEDKTKQDEQSEQKEDEQSDQGQDDQGQDDQEDEQSDEQSSQEAEQQDEDASDGTFTTSSGNTATVEVPEEGASASTDPLTSNTTSDETSGWAARIDAYLSGSPLAGYGATFAQAAATYGADPRLSPAISCVESGKGSACFLPHNAWGWGSSSWSSWEEAINDHVAGLASLYGGTLTIEGAQMYCPPTYQEWYSSVLAEMNSI